MTPQQTLKIVSAVATAGDSILAYGDRIADVPGVPPGLAHAWPLIFLGIVAIDRGLHAYLGEPAPVVPQTAFSPTPPQAKIETVKLTP